MCANTFISGVYWWKWSRQWAHLELCTGTLILLKQVDILLNWITLFNLTAGKCAPIQAVNRQFVLALNTKERSCSSFQINYESYNPTSFTSEDRLLSKCHLTKKNKKKKKWEGTDMERWKFSSALILFKEFCLLPTRMQDVKQQNICSDAGHSWHCCHVDFIELKLKWCMEKSKNIWEKRYERL